MAHMANGKKAAAARRKYVKGRQYEQGFLDHLKESLRRHRGKKKQSVAARARRREVRRGRSAEDHTEL